MRIFEIKCNEYSYALLDKRVYLVRKCEDYYKLKEIAFRELNDLILKEVIDETLHEKFVTLLRDYYKEKLEDLCAYNFLEGNSYENLREAYEEFLIFITINADI